MNRALVGAGFGFVIGTLFSIAIMLAGGPWWWWLVFTPPLTITCALFVHSVSKL